MKSRHTWQRLSLGWKVAKSCGSVGKHPGSLHLVSASNRCVSIRRYSVSRDVETTICFSLFSFPPQREAVLSHLCERQCYPVSARDSVLLASARGSVGLASARGILLSVCMRDSFLFVCTLVDARISHVVVSHLLRALDHVVAT